MKTKRTSAHTHTHKQTYSTFIHSDLHGRVCGAQHSGPLRRQRMYLSASFSVSCAHDVHTHTHSLALQITRPIYLRAILIDPAAATATAACWRHGGTRQQLMTRTPCGHIGPYVGREHTGKTKQIVGTGNCAAAAG